MGMKKGTMELGKVVYSRTFLRFEKMPINLEIFCSIFGWALENLIESLYVYSQEFYMITIR